MTVATLSDPFVFSRLFRARVRRHVMDSLDVLAKKGTHLDALVEEAVDDLLIVSVNVRGRKLSGILFDTAKR